MSGTPSGRSVQWLVLRAQAGDRRALEDLLLFTHGALLPFIRIMSADDDLAADILQDVLLAVYRKLGALRDPRAYMAWVRRIASRTVAATMQRAKHGVPLDEAVVMTSDTSADGDGDGGQDDMRAEVSARLPELLQQVSPASREVLALHYGDELTIDEIAAVLDLPVGTVKSRLAYGLRKLRVLAGV